MFQGWESGGGVDQNCQFDRTILPCHDPKEGEKISEDSDTEERPFPASVPARCRLAETGYHRCVTMALLFSNQLEPGVDGKVRVNPFQRFAHRVGTAAQAATVD